MESAAIIYFNSVLGARTNRCGFFVLFAALTGKYPKIGYLLDQNRRGTHLVSVQTKLDGPTDYGALGYHVGAVVGGGVPVFEGINNPRQEELIMLGAGLATSGAVCMYHIPGITPEASTSNEAFGGKSNYDEIVMTKRELNQVYRKLRNATDCNVDFIYLGCPQYTLEQIRVVAELLEKRKIHENTVLWIGTNQMAFSLAERMGYYDVIKNAGGKLVCDTCPVDSFLRTNTLKKSSFSKPSFHTMLTDSAKQAHYAKSILGYDILLDKVEVCIEAAIKGRWGPD
jgi:predicted aconitase